MVGDQMTHIKPSQLVEALCLTVPYSPAMIWGAPGVGKSQIIQGGIDKIFAAAAKGRNVPAGVKPVLFERRIKLRSARLRRSAAHRGRRSETGAA